MQQKLLSFLALALFVASRALAAEAVPWHVKDAPYRAVVTLSQSPQDAEAGVAIELPEFGYTTPSLAEVQLVDASGKPVALAPAFRSEGQTAAVIAMGLQKNQEYYAYFGGRNKGPKPWQPKLSLVMETRRAPDAKYPETLAEMEGIWKKATQVDGAGFVKGINHGENPYGESFNFVTHYTGWLRTGGRNMQIYTISSDASFVLVNDKLVLSWPGKHGPHANEKNVRQTPIESGGQMVKVDYYHMKLSGEQPVMCLGMRGKRLEAIPEDQWLQPGTASIKRVEDARGMPAPVGEIKLKSYIGYGDQWLYEVHCTLGDEKLPADWTAQWQWGDGALFTGPECTRILPSVAPQKVTLSFVRGKEVSKGTRRISFGGQIFHASIKSESNTKHYIDVLAKETPAQLSPATLRADLAFLLEFADNDRIAPFADAWLRHRPDPSDALWGGAQLARLRVLAQKDPKAAADELRKIDSGARIKHKASLDVLEADLHVFYLREPNAASRIQQLAFAHGGTEVGRLLRVRVGDSLRLVGKLPEAIAQYQATQKQAAEETKGKKLPAMDKAMSITIADMLTNGYRREAEEKLIEWEAASPMAKITSDILLVRARVLMEFGRWSEALSEVESFEKLQPDSPYQIDSQFLRARCHWQLGRKEEGRKLFAEIAKKYPKHKLAAESEDWSRKK